MMDSFLVIFSNISKQLLQGTPSEAASWRFFVPRKQALESVRKADLKNFRTPEEIVRWGIYFFNFSEENRSTIDGFLKFLWNVLEQLF